jgi:DNA polymerase (family 10)
MENADVARVLAEVADLLELTGGKPFKMRAYRQAAQIVDLLPAPVSELWREGKLTELPSVGERIADHIEELLSTRRFAEHDRLLRKVPPGVLEFLKIEGVGPKRSPGSGSTSWRSRRWRRPAGTARWRNSRGWVLGESPQSSAHWSGTRRGRDGSPAPRAGDAESIAERLRKAPHVRAAEVAGSIRWRRETIGDIDLLVSAVEPEGAIRGVPGGPGSPGAHRDGAD